MGEIGERGVGVVWGASSFWKGVEMNNQKLGCDDIFWGASYLEGQKYESVILIVNGDGIW